MKVYIYKRDEKITSAEYAADALARFSRRERESFVFERGEHGKPYVKGESIYFSLSHSGDVLICAVGRSEVGADVEKMREIKRSERIAARCFAGEKISDERDFFKHWTRKEAFLKYTGEGFSGGIGKNAGEDVFLLSFEEPEGYMLTVCAGEEEKIEVVRVGSVSSGR
ncbi:MAG: 4'-phosphopantetheinyl transferase superfamily protein [Clostridia bacterium]|nr:4'-phosphopantetheinyl transferase superfamily protein [Clostridia bacterium]